jgi:cobalt/nickel transport system permease protein
MTGNENQLFSLNYLDILSRQDTAMHRLDPRAKVLTVCAFIIAVVSFGKYEVSALLPFFLFPAVIIGSGNLPAVYLAQKILVILPFALLIGIANPVFDREVQLRIGAVAVSGGWISCCSIVLRFVLTALAALILIATTGFTGVCAVLERFGLPRVFTVQLLFIHRYLFVLTDEAARMSRARALRSFGIRGMRLKTFCPLVGHLLLRTIDRAQRIYLAMVSRGFSGSFKVSSTLCFGRREAAFTAGWIAAFILLRLVNLPQALGRAVEGLLR